MNTYITTLEAILLGAASASLFINSISYALTIDVARKQEKWTSEEFSEKCDSFWKQSFVREDLTGVRKKLCEAVLNFTYRPGAYLACKYLSRKGYALN